MIIGGIAGGVAVLAYALLSPRRHCPACAAALPRFRQPATGKQALLGGWTCPGCGIEIDRKGNRRE
jgi:rubredoxin